MTDASTAPADRRPAGRGWHRLDARIVALFLSLLLLVQVVSFVFVRGTLAASARTEVQREMLLGERVLQRVLAQHAEQLRGAAQVLAADFGFRSAIASGDRATMASALENQAERAGAQVALYANPRFELVAQAQHQGLVLDAEGLASLRGRLSGGQDGRLLAVQGRLLQFVSVPVKAPLPIGWVLMGFPIDEAFLRDVRGVVPLELALLVGEERTGWRVAAQALDPGVGTPDLADRLGELDHQAELAVMMLDGHAHGVRLLGLTEPGGVQARAVLLQSMDEVTAPFERLQWTLLLLTVLGVLAFGVGSVLTARRITTPIKGLSAAAAVMEGGDYSTPVSVAADDEIGELAQSLEGMRLAVRRRDEDIRALAYTDRLTGLPNREAFRAHVASALAGIRQRGTCAGVLLLNLDRFKHVNDVLGPAFGDLLLQAAAQRLKEQAALPGQFVARLGGDEFGLLLPEADSASTEAAAQRVMAAFAQSLRIDEQTVDLSAGIGMALFPAHADEVDSLVSRAEQAMSIAKQGVAGAVMYDPARDSANPANLGLLSDMRRALAAGELRLHLQPKIHLQTEMVVGAEALVRWHHPQRGLVPPMQFIPFAEKTGFIREITKALIAQAAQLMARVADEGLRVKISVNLSTRDLLDPELPEALQRLLAAHQVPAEGLCLEITESAIMDDPQRALRTLDRLKDLGLSLSIDDFGTGYSSLAYLKRLPVDELKIDRSFVQGLEQNVDDAKIVRSTIDLAHNLGLRVVAEGVETARAWTLLKALGCDEAQGYFMGRPMPADDFLAWARRWRLPDVSAARLETDWAMLVPPA